MKKRDLLKRIEELEQRVKSLEARPMVTYVPTTIPAPSWPDRPYEITWTGTSSSTPKTDLNLQCLFSGVAQ